MIDTHHLEKRNILEYKYVIYVESTKQAKKWEPLVGNRVIDILNNKEIFIEDIFG